MVKVARVHHLSKRLTGYCWAWLNVIKTLKAIISDNIIEGDVDVSTQDHISVSFDLPFVTWHRSLWQYIQSQRFPN